MEVTGKKEIFAFYNVENLLLPDPPPVHKSNPTRSGFRKWDERKYRIKLSKIAQVFQLMEDSEGLMPAAIGLCEVQGRQPLEDLLAMPQFRNYCISHFNSPDIRGIDVALLYDNRKLQHISSRSLHFDLAANGNVPDSDPTRDILHCKFEFMGHILNIFVLHLPSRREKDTNQNRRNYILKQLKETLIKDIPVGEGVIICGDFNANPDEETLMDLMYKDSVKILTNPFAELFASKKFSTYHRGNGLLFDQMILSYEFFREDFPLHFTDAKIFNHQKLSGRERKFSGRPAQTFAGTRYLGGYSDHFPITTEFKSLNKL